MSLEEVYLKNALIPKRYEKEIELRPSKADLEVFKELNEIRTNIKEFVNGGNNLLICSNNVGNGKSTWSIKLLKAYINAVANKGFKYDTPALFVNLNSFLNEKKMAINDFELADKIKQMEKCILSAKLVVFDDIADKTLSEYDMNMMYYWIDYRTSNLLSCIFTSNQKPEQLKRTLSGKVYSRIVNYSSVKYFTDGDHRGA